MHSASGILLRLDKPLLVTAEHVIKPFLDQQMEEPSLKLMIGKVALDNVSERIIGRSTQPDLITLDLSGVNSQSIADHVVFYEPAKWPPTPVIRGATVIFSGFPMAYRNVLHALRAIKFNSWHVCAEVATVSDRDFTCVINPRDMQNANPETVWPTSYGAISGCPIFGFGGEITTLKLVGIVYEALNNFHVIKAHHTNLIEPDGMLLI